MQDTRDIEGIPVPVDLVVEWDHVRWMKPYYYGHKPSLRHLATIRHLTNSKMGGVLAPGETMGSVILPRGGRTICRLLKIGVEDELRYIVAEGVSDCSLDDNYVKAVGRKRSLSAALTSYYKQQSLRGVGTYRA